MWNIRAVLVTSVVMMFIDFLESKPQTTTTVPGLDDLSNLDFLDIIEGNKPAPSKPAPSKPTPSQPSPAPVQPAPAPVQPAPAPNSPVSSSGCPSGFFKSAGSNQCFKLFSDVKRNWEEAKKKCDDAGLLMANPTDAVAVTLRNDLLEIYGDGNVWLGARGDGSTLVWEQDDTALRNDSPLWYNKSNLGGASRRHCLGLAHWPNALREQPGRVFYSYECQERSRSTLCEAGVDEIIQSG